MGGNSTNAPLSKREVREKSTIKFFMALFISKAIPDFRFIIDANGQGRYPAFLIKKLNIFFTAKKPGL